MHTGVERNEQRERQAYSFKNENWKGENKNLEEPLTQQRVSKSW